MTTSWFDVPERVIIDWSHRCDAASVYHATVGAYLAAECVPILEMAQRRYLRSADGHQLLVPSYGRTV